MASEPVLKIDKKAIGELAKGAAAQAVVTEVANRIAAAAGPDADVREYTTDRAVASVAVSADDQAADGVLSRAASSVGISISGSST
jgi:hypothetical protein